MENTVFDFENTLIHPGDNLKHILKVRGLTLEEFSEKSGISEDELKRFLDGKFGVTSELAQKLANCLGTSPNTWSELQRIYEIQMDKQFQTEKSLFDRLGYAFFFKLRMVKTIPILISDYARLLHFLSVSSLSELKYRDAFSFYKSDAQAIQDFLCINAWVKTAIYIAERRHVEPYNAEKLKGFVSEIRAMTLQSPSQFQKRLHEIFEECGVSFVVLPTMESAGINAAVKWLSRDKVLLAINDNGKDADKFWFALFHEIKHILQEVRTEMFVSYDDDEIHIKKGDLEDEANTYSREILIPKKYFEPFIQANDFSEESILNFAEKIKIHPGIVVGRLQHDGYIEDMALDKLKSQYVIEISDENVAS